MSTDTGYTYMVTGHVVVDGEVVPPGTILEEANDWKYRDLLVDRGKLTRVTNEAAKGAPRHERAETSDEPSGEEPVETPPVEDEELTQEQYDALNVDEVEALIEPYELSADELEEFESNRPGNDRKGILSLVEALREEEAEEDEDDEEEDDDNE